ncbi:hypothetical protein LUZ60_001431 [Juncus effusus]|nr:hypothetical protein LUZ60_001431 [Juncus effusus]
MADDYHTEICSTEGGGINWWNPNRTGTAGTTGFEETVTSVSCSTAVTDLETKSRSYDDSVGSGSGNSDMGSSISDSTLQLPFFGLSPSPVDWSQNLLRGSGKAETSLNPMQYFQHEQRSFEQRSFESNQVQETSLNQFNQNFMLDQTALGSGPGATNEAGVITTYNNPLSPVTYNYDSNMVQSLFETGAKTQLTRFGEQNVTMGYNNSELLQASWNKFPLKSSPLKQNQSNQLHFSNDTPFWNPSAFSSQFVSQTFEPKSNSSSLIEKLSCDGVQEACSSISKNSGLETGFKKPRIETPSPLPTFKVRKEKLGDRITALQQLVSPFGKTDTASVLHEAIEYIKFLHDQVSQVLSTPYLKNGNPMQQQQVSDKSKENEGPKQDLTSRGLCLVPIANTYPVASETTADFWHPTFGGTFR